MSIKEKIKEVAFLKKLLKRLYLKIRSDKFVKLSQREKTDAKLVVFESFQGRSYSCSPKAIYEYMQKAPEFAFGFSVILSLMEALLKTQVL